LPASLHDRLVAIIRARGPISVASFMKRALYDPQDGYYTRAAQRSGKSGDFYTSVDVSPVFGATIAEQLVEMWRLLGSGGFHLVEAGAGNGRLARDILDAAAARHPDFYACVRVTLVERSAAARAAQAATLAAHAARAASSDTLPAGVQGAIVANELLDALPVTIVQMTDEGFAEVAVGERDGVLMEELRPLLHRDLAGVLPAVDPGQRIEIGCAASQWIGGAADSVARGFLLLFDYGYRPSAEYFRAHPEGTLMAYRSHRASGSTWLSDPGERDITAHVNLEAIQSAAEAHGLQTLGIVDQRDFLLSLGLVDRLDAGADRRATWQHVAARTLIMPGGLGDTMKAMVFAKGMGAPALAGLRSGRLI
jgi:SAM-dependent MidA family methyltransferase